MKENPKEAAELLGVRVTEETEVKIVEKPSVLYLVMPKNPEDTIYLIRTCICLCPDYCRGQCPSNTETCDNYCQGERSRKPDTCSNDRFSCAFWEE